MLVRIGHTRDTPALSRAARQPPRSTPLLSAVVAALRLMSVGLDGWRRAAGGAREDEADRRPPPWFRLLRRIPQRGRARHAVLTYARRPLRFREGRFGHHPPTEAATQKYGRAKLTDYRIDGKGRDMVYFTCLTGGMAERLGRGLQIRLQRFNSASHLHRKPRTSGAFL